MKKNITIEDLAMMTQKGFEETTKKMEVGFQKINERFDNVENRLLSLENRLSSLERRMFAVEEILTEHGKELRKIKKILAQLQQQKRVDHEKIILLEKRTARLETAAAAM